MRVADLIAYLEELAPPALAESYDNVGLLCGHPEAAITGVYCVLDCLPERVQEAIDRGCNVVVAHHPLIFKGIRRIDARHWTGRALELAIKHDVALYAIHTNLDNVLPGVNTMLARRIGLLTEQIRPLRPMQGQLLGLATFVPAADAPRVLQACWAAGAGQVGQYHNCAFQTEGQGFFTPGTGTNPHTGQVGRPEQTQELRLELLVPAHRQRAVLAALKASHPYEEVAYYLYPLQNTWQDHGAGAVADLPTPLPFADFLRQVCQGLGIGHVRHTEPGPGKLVRRVAVCGGAGAFLLDDAKRAGADVLLTGDVKHHEFLEATTGTVFVDVGHYESERLVADELALKIKEKFATFAVHLPEPGQVQSPVHWFTL